MNRTQPTSTSSPRRWIARLPLATAALGGVASIAITAALTSPASAAHTDTAHTSGARIATPQATTAVLPAAAVAASIPAPSAPRVSPSSRTFFWMNVLRSSHDSYARRTAGSRMRTDVSHIKKKGITFGVLAETESDQRASFRKDAGSGYALVTGGNGLDNVVFYKKSAFSLVETRHLTTYYFGGQHINTAVPVLRDKSSGGIVAVIPVHNPADAWGYKDAGWRNIDKDAEISEVRSIRQAHPTWGVVVAGDFNEKSGPACQFTKAGLDSLIAKPSTCTKSGIPIDQMFSTNDLNISGYKSTKTSATDHGREYQAHVHV